MLNQFSVQFSQTEKGGACWKWEELLSMERGPFFRESLAHMDHGVICQITHSTFPHVGLPKHLVGLNSTGSMWHWIFFTFFFFMSCNCQQYGTPPPWGAVTQQVWGCMGRLWEITWQRSLFPSKEWWDGIIKLKDSKNLKLPLRIKTADEVKRKPQMFPEEIWSLLDVDYTRSVI